MAVLGFDTCFGACSVALRWQSDRGEWLLREEYVEGEAAGAERLVPMIGELMEAAAMPFSRLRRVAVTLGPGTFTGVRTGVAVARALALANGLEAVGLSSLAVIAHRADMLLGARREGRRMAVAADARRGAVYLQVFGDNAGDALSAPELVSPDEALVRLAGMPTIVVGTGAPMIAAAARSGSHDLNVALERLLPHARPLVMLAPLLTPAHSLRPLYVRAPDARLQAHNVLTRTG